jgi:uncharacterized damage-inducible protein DinB
MTLEALSELLAGMDENLARIERCLGRLPDEALWKRPRAGMNSVANLCLHLAGNESHYIGRGVGGTDYVRDRPFEFRADGGVARAEILDRLREARATTRRVVSGLQPSDLGRRVKSDHPPEPTVLKVILHVAEHYAYHTGQIVLLTRLLQEGEERLLQWGH